MLDGIFWVRSLLARFLVEERRPGQWLWGLTGCYEITRIGNGIVNDRWLLYLVFCQV